MTFDWDSYKELAEELRLRDDEASKRSVISRLYYSVYHKARILLETEDPNFYVAPDKSHYSVWGGFLNKGHTKRQVHTRGMRLKNYRVEADYESEMEKIEETVEASFILAEEIIKTLNLLSGKN